MELIIVRHALPRRDERSEGSADPPLSEHGRRQAEATAEFLAGERVDHIAASSMQRAMQTAEPLAARLGLTVEPVDDLREVDQHRNRYVPAEELTMDDPIAMEFFADPFAIFGGDYDGFRDRVSRGFDHLVDSNRGRRVAVFCHGMVMSVYLRTIMGHDDPYKLQPDYCGIMRVQASSTGIRTVRSANETGHVRGLL